MKTISGDVKGKKSFYKGGCRYVLTHSFCAGAEAEAKSADRQRKPGNESHKGARSMSAEDAVLGNGPQDLGDIRRCMQASRVGQTAGLCTAFTLRTNRL